MSNRTNGSIVRELEREFARYVGAEYAIACCNGTASLHTALVALGVQPGDRVAVPPLTMASTTLAVLHAGAVPVFVDVEPETWVMRAAPHFGGWDVQPYTIGVSLYGLHYPGGCAVDDAAQTLRKDCDREFAPAFTSYSFQASKILSAGEGGVLVTNDAELADRARSFANLGYGWSTIDDLKHPNAVRHLSIGYNFRLSDLQAAALLPQLERVDEILTARRYSADCYRQAIDGCDWITPQFVPAGWSHSWWAFAIALDRADRWEPFAQAIVDAGGEHPYGAWRVTYQEPAFRHLASDGTCPVAEDLQPRLMQLQTNYARPQARRAAECLRRAIANCTVSV